MPQFSGKQALFCQTADVDSPATNPADLSAPLRELFPAGAVAADLRTTADPNLLLPAEAECVRGMVPKRAGEFAAGRLCARRALAEFGIIDFPIEAAADRQPIWPGTMVGSITHTTGYCAAVTAPRRHFAALGLDSEVVGDLKAQIWSRICGPAEITWIRSLPASQQAAAVTLIFAAKEAFYKCQYPLVKERLLFHDVAIGVTSWDPSAGTFQVQATRTIALSKRTPMPVAGRYLVHEGHVTAGMGVGAAEGSVQ